MPNWRNKPDLTPREREILSAIGDGYSNKEIAEYFEITEDTVSHHRSNIFDKLGVWKRWELALRSECRLWAADRVRYLIFTSALATGIILVLIAVIQSLRQ